MSFTNQIIAALICTATVVAPLGLAAQCPITVHSGPDKFVCAIGGTVELEGNISGPDIGFRWTPATGLDNAGILNPTATVNSMVTYTLTGAAADPSAPNLVNNPGFESGNTGFTSGYAYNPTPITPGTYVLTTSPALVLASFPPCDDHTYGDGTGFMMLCNGNGGPSTQVWCQTIPVMPNSWYLLSAWVMSSPISPPIMQFKVNGANVGDPFSASSGGCVWQEFTATWYSGTATSANYCIFDLNGSGNGLFGDDFALDDVFMAKACSVSDQVKVSVAPVNAVVPATATLPCSAAQTGIVLNGSGSSTGPGYSYNWDGPGIVSGGNTLTPTVNEPGAYTLTVSFDTGDGICTKEATIQVLPDPLQVMAAAATGNLITCANPTVMLNGAGSSVGGFVTYNWQPAAGIVSGNGTLFPIVNQAGQYTLLVTHSVSGCTATAEVVVNQNTTPPAAAAAVPGALPCIAGTLTLSGAGSATGSNIQYQWAGPGIVSGGTSLNNCVVNAPGAYTLTVTNTVNGCTATATANVIQGGTPPVVMAAANAPGALNCVTPVLTLNSSGSSNDSTFTFLWSTANGRFAGPVNGQTAAVDSVGTYILTITNTVNGCTATDTVSVAGLFTPPALAVNLPAPPITCATDSVQIDASASAAGPGILAQWTTPNGQILSGDTTLTPWVGAAGAYMLLITDTTNGCTASAIIPVTADTLAPLAMAAANAPGVLNCVTASLTLNSAGSSTDSTVVFGWSTADGHFTGPVNGQTANIDSVGTYILTLTNTANGCTASAAVTVQADTLAPIAAIAAAAPGVLNCVTALLTLNSGTNNPLFTYDWTTAGGHFAGPVNEPAATVDSAGLYILTIANPQNGCTATAAISILQHANVGILPTAQTNLTCFEAGNGSIAVTAMGGDSTYTYAWTNGAGTPAISNLAAGTYTLTVTDGENCSATAGFTLSQPAELLAQAVATPPSATGASDGTAAASPVGGTGPYTFLWNTGANTPLITGLVAGLYTVTVTDANGCTAVQTVQVWEGDCVVSAVMSPVNPGCAGSADGQALVTLSGGTPPYVYTWTSGGTGALETGLPAGIHTVTVTDFNGCQVTESVVLTDPPALVLTVIALQPTSCPGLPGGSATVAGSGGTGAVGISWSNGQSGPTAVGLPDGVYIATATDANGCTDTSAVTIEAIDLEAPVIQAGATTVPLGPSGSVTLTLVNLGAAAVDNCALAAVQIVPDEFDCSDIGIQQVTLTASDVSGNSISVIIAVTIVDNIPPTLDCPPSITRCFSDNIVEHIAPVATDNCLSLGGQFALVEGLPSGSEFPVGTTTNTYTFTDAQGNAGSCSFQVEIFTPLSVVSDSIIHDIGNQKTGGVLVTVGGSQSGYTYQWTSGGQTLAETEDLTGVGMGAYTLLVTDAAGCTAEAGPFEVSNLTDTDNPDWTDRVGVFPNPTTGQLFVLFPSEMAGAEMDVAVYDATGRRVLSQYVTGQSQLTLDLDRFADGLYTLAIRAAGRWGVWKIAVMR